MFRNLRHKTPGFCFYAKNGNTGMGMEIQSGYGPSLSGIRQSARAEGYAAFMRPPAGLEQDRFTRQGNRPETPGQDDPFSMRQAAKNLLKGMVSPVTALLKHPAKALAMLAGTVVLATLAPVTVPLMLAGFAAMSLFQAGQGARHAFLRYQAGDIRGAENAFEEVGAGLVGVALSALGVRGSAAVAAESRAAVRVLSAQPNAVLEANFAGIKAAASAQTMTFRQALGENLKMFTTREGWQTVKAGMKPSALLQNVRMLGARIQEMRSARIRRAQLAGLSDEQVRAMAEAEVHQSFDRWGIPKTLRPKVLVTKDPALHGEHVLNEHVIRVNPDFIRSGKVSVRNVAWHESLHAREALLRARLSESEIREAVVAEILRGIREGEVHPVLRGRITQSVNENARTEFVTIQAPPMSEALRHQVAELVERDILPQAKSWNELAWKTQQGDPAVLGAAPRYRALQGKVKALLTNSPEGQAQGMQDALMEYIRAQAFRMEQYPILHQSLPVQVLKQAQATPLSVSERQAAIQSVKDYISNLEGNLRLENPAKSAMDKLGYLSAKEEVLARNTAAEADLEVVNKALAGVSKGQSPEGMVQLRHLLRRKMALEAEVRLNDTTARWVTVEARLKNDPGKAELQQQRAQVVGEIAAELPFAQNLRLPSDLAYAFPKAIGGLKVNQRAIELGTEFPDAANPAFLPHFTDQPSAEEYS
jgi:hypothetical protein